MKPMPIAKLGTLTSLISSGSTPLGGASRYLPEGPVMFIRSQNVRMNGLDLSDVVYIDSALHAEMKRTHVRSGDVFINITGASIGRVAAFDRNGDKANVNQHVCIIRPKPEQLDFRYLTTLLCSPQYQENINRLQRGGTRQALTFDMIANFDIPLPSLSEQRRIAAILDKADAIRRKREEGIRLTEALLRSTFLEMLGDPATNPKGWEIVPLGQAISVKSGDFLPAKAMNSDGEYPVYGGNGVNGRHDKYLFDTPQIVIGRVGIYCGAIHYTAPFSWVTDNALYVSERKVALLDQYLVAALSHANLNQYASRSGQPLISGQRISQVPLAIPPMTMQQKFGGAINKVHELHSRRQSAFNECHNLFQSLVHRAFRGEL